MPLRVTGADLRCKVVGEGANLGMTQRGRVEAALAGIRLNTDAIDNSAGVNTSDVEVNIKIALSVPVRAGALTLEARNALLAEMTDEVARLVLRNNYQQTLALSLAQRRGLEDLGFQQRLMQTLESRGLLDRAVEFLPDDMALGERRKRNLALTRPELAVLLAYAKLTLYSELLDSNVPDDPYLGRELNRYFPQGDDRAFPGRAAQPPAAARDHRDAIDQLDDQPRRRDADRAHRRPDRRAAGRDRRRLRGGAPELRPGRAQRRDRRARQQGARRIAALALCVPCRICCSTGWSGSCAMPISRKGWRRSSAHYRDGIGAVEAALDGALSKSAAAALAARSAELAQGRRAGGAGAPHRGLAALKAAPDIVLVADRAGKPVAEVTATYFATESFFQLDRVAGAASGIAVSDYFDRLALDRALDSIGDAERRLTAAMVGNGRAGARRGGGMGQAAPGRSRAHPRGDPRDRRLRADAVEAVGGGEPAGRFGAGEVRSAQAR